MSKGFVIVPALALLAAFVSSIHDGDADNDARLGLVDSMMDGMETLEMAPLEVACEANGWQIVGSAEAGYEEPVSKNAAPCQNLKNLLEKGGVAVLRPGVTDNEKRFRHQKAMFKELIAPGSSTLQAAYATWYEPWKEVIKTEGNGAEDKFNEGAEQRQEAQLARYKNVLATLNSAVPKTFGAVWVMMALEEERDWKSHVKKATIRIAAFKYVADADAAGAGGIQVKSAANGLGSHINDITQNCMGRRWFVQACSSDVGPPESFSGAELRGMPEDMTKEVWHARQTFKAIYAKTFGFANKYLGKEARQKSWDSNRELYAFVEECKGLTDKAEADPQIGKNFPMDMVDRANQLIEEYEEANHGGKSAAINTQQRSVLKRFLDKGPEGGARYVLGKKAEDQTRRSNLRANKAAEKAFKARQQGADRIPDEGDFTLADGAFDVTLPIFFEDALARGRWVCFRMPMKMETTHYLVHGAEQEETFDDKFHNWQNGLPKGTRGVLSSADRKAWTDAMKTFSGDHVTDFETAKGALATIAESQTLCAHRFQPPMTKIDEAQRRGAEAKVFDLSVTWSGAEPDPQMTVAPKMLAMKGWLLAHHVIHTDVVRDATPANFGITYADAKRKAGF